MYLIGFERCEELKVSLAFKLEDIELRIGCDSMKVKMSEFRSWDLKASNIL